MGSVPGGGGDGAADGRAQKASADKAAALEPKLPRLAIKMSAVTRVLAGVEVKRDGVVVAPAVWGDAIPVDPGMHGVTVTAPEKKPWSSSAEASLGATVSVEVPPLVDEAPAVVAPVSPVLAPPIAERVPSSWSDRKTAGVVLMSAGGVAAILGGAFAAQAHSKYATLDTQCPQHTGCSQSLASTLSSYHTASGVSVGSFVGAGAALVTGIVVFVVAPKTTERPSAFVAPGVGLGTMELRGGF